MEKLVKLIERVGKLDFDTVMQDAFKSIPVTQEVSRLNRDRLFYEGKDTKGIKLKTIQAQLQGKGNVYALSTIREKKKFGDPYDRVTLKFTGQFHDSFKIKSFPGYAEITGNSEKDDGFIEHNFYPVYWKNILGLHEDQIPELNTVLRPILQKSIRVDIL